ncbi:hypothetical protein GFS60_03638 [Rhodococcus sp. WAY2]|nr:hypothetical protein GFS60_03638 [Rhodococcus sp. WAY2]
MSLLASSGGCTFFTDRGRPGPGTRRHDVSRGTSAPHHPHRVRSTPPAGELRRKWLP